MAHAFRTLTALAAWSGLVIQLWILLTSGQFALPVHAVWRFFAFFTILTNILVAVVSTVSVLAPRSAAGRFVDGANMRAALLLYIGAVGIVYHLLLAGLWAPEGWQLLADRLLHTVTPAMVALGWLAFDDKRGLSFKALPAYLVYPVGYTGYALARGVADGFYPYPFIDVTQIGYAGAFANIAGLAACFVAGGALIIMIGKTLSSFGIRTAPEG